MTTEYLFRDSERVSRAARRAAAVRRRGTLACTLGLGLLVACDGTHEPAACFPVPTGAEVLFVYAGMESQGTRLQGESDFVPHQGTSLQGESDYVPHQDTSLQGESNIMTQQGSRLQGAPTDFINNQGTTLQGESNFMQNQGTSLQRESNFMQQQGASLQGAQAGQEGQGTHLQGARAGEEEQGTHLQGGSHQRAYRGLLDLNGARLAIEADPSNAVILQDGQLVARGFADTVSLRGTPMLATAPDGRQFRVEIGALTVAGRTQHIELLVDGVAACKPELHGMFVPGRWDVQASHVDDLAVVTYSCTDGVIAKCVDWGYAPWVADANVHATCVRLARADYCGNNISWTMDGTLINVFDGLGIHSASSNDDMKFEAAWGPDGATCIARSRYEVENAAGQVVLPSCFATLRRCNSFEDEAARGAVLANRSKVTSIEACE